MTQLMHKLAKPITGVTIFSLFSQLFLLCCINVTFAATNIATISPPCHQNNELSGPAITSTNLSLDQENCEIEDCVSQLSVINPMTAIEHNSLSKFDLDALYTEFAIKPHTAHYLAARAPPKQEKTFNSPDLYLTYCSFLE